MTQKLYLNRGHSGHSCHHGHSGFESRYICSRSSEFKSLATLVNSQLVAVYLYMRTACNRRRI